MSRREIMVEFIVRNHVYRVYRWIDVPPGLTPEDLDELLCEQARTTVPPVYADDYEIGRAWWTGRHFDADGTPVVEE